MIQYRKTNYVVETDFRGLFDDVDCDWLVKILKHDIADKIFFKLREMSVVHHRETEPVQCWQIFIYTL